MKNTKNIIYFILAAIVLASLIFYVTRQKKITVDVAQVKAGTFEDIIKSDGFFRAKERYTVSVYATGNIGRLEVKVGDHVNKGQVLAVLDWDYKMKIVSPIDGVVTKIFRESAGPINRGEPVVEIANPKNLEVVAELLTMDAVRVQNGNLIRIDNWGGKEKLTAKVVKKSAAGFTKVSALGVEEERTEVVAHLNTSESEILNQIGDNFHMDLSIIVSQAQDALKIPIGALFKFEDRWAVFTVVDNKARLTPIEIHNKNYEEAWVKFGLKTDDTVILHPGDLIKDGVVVVVTQNVH